MPLDDVDTEYRRLVLDGGLDVVLPVRTEKFGQRHFIVSGPEGVLVDVITVIPPSDEYADSYRRNAVDG